MTPRQRKAFHNAYITDSSSEEEMSVKSVSGSSVNDSELDHILGTYDGKQRSLIL